MRAIQNLMDATVRLATQHGVGIGAHPGYRDLQGFGRRRINGTSDEIVNDIAYQVGALREFARRHGANLQHVKPHGALYMELAGNEALSRSFIKLMRTVAPNAFVFCMGISETYRVAKEAGQPVIREFYADRDYDSTGSIVFTRHVGRLDPDAVADKVVRACRDGKVRTVDGADIDIEFEVDLLPFRHARQRRDRDQDARCAHRKRSPDRAGVGSLLPRAASRRGINEQDRNHVAIAWHVLPPSFARQPAVQE